MPRPFVAAALLLALATTACGGQAGPDATSADPTDASVTPSSSAAGEAPAPTSGGSGDGAAYCLNTIAEVSAALGVEVASADGVANAGLGGGCMYTQADGQPVFAISVIDSSAAADAFEGYRQYEGAEEVGGIGDAALFLPMNDMIGIAFQKGDVVASLGPTMALDLSGDALRAAVEQLARQAADRT